MWDAYGHKAHRRLVELTEDYADGLISTEELAEARKDALQYRDEWETIEDGSSVAPSVVLACASSTDSSPGYLAFSAEVEAHWVFEYLRQVHVPRPPDGEDRRLLYEIFANPFRPKTIDAAWLAHNDGAAGKLARSAYHERLLPQGMLDPQRLAVLADALEEAGCSDAEILEHLRDRGPHKGPHYRGCWAVDLILAQAGGFAPPPKGRKKGQPKADEGRVLHTVEDMLKAADLLTLPEIARLKEGLTRLEQERQRPAKGRKSAK
jgi:hypothetical protein